MPVDARSGRYELCLIGLQFPLADGEKLRGRQINQLFGAIPSLDIRRTDREGSIEGTGSQRFQVAGSIGGELGSGDIGRLEQILARGIVGPGGKGQRQIMRQQIDRTTQHHSSPFDEYVWRPSDVRARSGEKRGQSCELGSCLPHPLRSRSGVLGDEVMQPVRYRGDVDHRITGPGPHRSQIEQPAIDDALEDASVDPLIPTQCLLIDQVELATYGPQPAHLLCNVARGEILKQVVVDMKAIAGGNGGMKAREMLEVVIDERSERSRRRDRVLRGVREARREQDRGEQACAHFQSEPRDEFYANGPRLIDDQTRPAEHLRSERAVVGEIGLGIREVLADDGELVARKLIRNARVEQ